MKRTQTQSGFSLVEVLIALVVVAAIGGTGYLAYTRMQQVSKTPTATEQTQKSVVPEATTVQKTSDLDSATKALDNTNVDATATDTSELDAQVNNF